MDFLEYDFDNAYVQDEQDTGNRPGVYIEFKENWLNPGNMEQRVYDVLDEEGWNIITKPATETEFYKNGRVNIGNTNGKVILQTFSFDALRRAYDVFRGKLPMCYLLWVSDPPYATDIAYDTPTGYAAFIKWAQDYGATIIGPAISGEPNNYPEMNNPWQAYMIRKSGMLNHPYSFDSYAQIYGNVELWQCYRIRRPAPPAYSCNSIFKDWRPRPACLYGRLLHQPLGNVTPVYDRERIPLQRQPAQSVPPRKDFRQFTGAT